MAKNVLDILAAATALVAACGIGSSKAEGIKFPETCREDVDSRKSLNRLRDQGVLLAEKRRSDQIVRLYVADRTWAAMSENERIDLAYHGYCMASDPSGHGTVLVKSHANEQVLYSVVDGVPQTHGK